MPAAAVAATRFLRRGYVQREIPGPTAALVARVQVLLPAAEAVPKKDPLAVPVPGQEMVMEAEI